MQTPSQVNLYCLLCLESNKKIRNPLQCLIAAPCYTHPSLVSCATKITQKNSAAPCPQLSDLWVRSHPYQQPPCLNDYLLQCAELLNSDSLITEIGLERMYSSVEKDIHTVGKIQSIPRKSQASEKCPTFA